MDAHRSTYTETTLRDAATVMAPDRLGAMHQNRISFVRSLIRKMASKNGKSANMNGNCATWFWSCNL